jgi:hypothetical protein
MTPKPAVFVAKGVGQIVVVRPDWLDTGAPHGNFFAFARNSLGAAGSGENLRDGPSIAHGC